MEHFFISLYENLSMAGNAGLETEYVRGKGMSIRLGKAGGYI